MSIDKILSRWLMVIMSLIVVIVVVGAITRLTNSGLSMPFWDIIDIFPPISESGWAEKFDEYKAFSRPDYEKQTLSQSGQMNLSKFKTIFWWEYIHRIIGRLIGMVALIPFLYFIYRKYLSKEQKINYLGIILLIAMQGTVGWLMVKSGLNQEVYNQGGGVSPYWLLIHLSLAFITFCWTLYNYLKISYKADINRTKIKFNPGKLIFIFMFVQILLGALMSGFKAAHFYDSFPLMNSQLIPDKIIFFKFDNIEFINFAHRWFAFVVVALIVGIYFKIKVKLSSKQKSIFVGLFYAIFFQIFLGILSLLNPVTPFDGTVDQIALAALHQLGAIIILAICTVLVYNFSSK